MSKSKVLAAIAAMFLGVGSAHASGAVAGATEFTQLANNFELGSNVIESAETARNTYAQYQKQIRQFEEQLRSGRILTGAIAGLTGVEFAREIQNVNRMVGILTNINGNTSQLRNMFDTRRVEAQTQGISLNRYYQREADRINHGDQYAKARLARQEQLMGEIQRDYQYTQDLGSQIVGTEGIHQSMQMLNTQMNKMIQQNARMMEITAQALNSDKAYDDLEKRDKEQVAKTLNLDAKVAREAYRDALRNNAYNASSRPNF